MSKFKIGDEVRVFKNPKNKTGIGEKFKIEMFSGKYAGYTKDKTNIWWSLDYLELVRPAIQSINGYELNNLVITADNIEERTRVLELLEERSDLVGYCSGRKPTLIDCFSNELSLRLNNGGIGSCTIYYYKQNYPSYTFITAKQFLGEQNNKPIKQNKLMNILKNAFKSDEQKALTHFNLVDHCGNLNEVGQQEFISFLFDQLKDEKKEFLSQLVKAYKEEVKK